MPTTRRKIYNVFNSMSKDLQELMIELWEYLLFGMCSTCVYL